MPIAVMSATLVKLVEAEPVRYAAYVALAFACVIVGMGLDQKQDRLARGQATFWLGLATLMLLLVFLKIVGVQFAIVEHIRKLAQADGWYYERRHFQREVIETILPAIGVVLLIVLYKLGNYRVSLGPPVVAVTALLTFILIRAISLHQVDSVIYRSDFVGVQVSALAELALLLLVAATAVLTWLFYVGFSRSDHVGAPARPSPTSTLVLAAGPAPSIEPAASTAPQREARRKRKRKSKRKS